jgi:hypothetical protein
MKDSIIFILTSFFVGMASVLLFPSNIVAAGFNFEPSSITKEVNSSFEIEIIIDTKSEQVGGAGAIIRYDINSIKINSIIPGDVFADYPILSINDKIGQANISGIVGSPNELYTGKGIFAKLNVTGIKTGETSLSFEFEKGKTSDSNIATTYAPYDILTDVNIAVINLTAGQTSQLSTEDSLEPTSIPENSSIYDTNEESNFFSDFIAKINIFSPDYKNNNKYSAITRGKPKTDPINVQQPARIANSDSFTYLPIILLAGSALAVLISILIIIKRKTKA